MVSSPEEKILYSEIQKKLFYIIPEKWESIHLYASVIDVPNQKPIGEMYFYYLPKGFIKKKYVNGYEIPNIFNIDEEQYSKLITDVYNKIKLLRERFVLEPDDIYAVEQVKVVAYDNGRALDPVIAPGYDMPTEYEFEGTKMTGVRVTINYKNGVTFEQFFDE